MTDLAVTGMTADSRAVQPGFLFAALPGSHADGRAFINDAIAKGAVAILAPEGTRINAPNVALITDPDPRRRFARMAAVFHAGQPDHLVAVTGTNGKTSTADFFRQMWTMLGQSAASIGTLGVIAPGWSNPGGLTTPDPVVLHKTLAALTNDGVRYAAVEASSHGLDQGRLDGTRLTAAAFTNLTRDHLDYHPDMEAYATAKLRLFAELLPEGGTAVVNADSEQAARIVAIARGRDLRILTYGRRAKDIRLVSATPEPGGQRLVLDLLGREHRLTLPLAGAFQAANALAALGLVIASGADPDKAVKTLEGLKGVPGRLEKVAERRNGAAVYVDYAHTPDALETVLTALRPHARGRLVVVFGCGGDRDPGKRPQMGAIAARLADRVLVTDDNPRGEDPAVIRAAILAAAPNAGEIADRADAIRTACAELEAGDLLLLAGKGHETGQIVGATVHPFHDGQTAVAAIKEIDGPLWTSDEARTAVAGCPQGPAWTATGVSIDSRTLAAGDLFIAIKGPTHDGHDHVAAALAKGAAAALVERVPADVAADAPLLVVADAVRALEDLARAARARSMARIVAVTGSVGKTGTKEMLRTALARQGEVHASLGNLNNHLGVPLSLARLPATARWAVFEIGMNHPGEIRPLTKLVRPHVAVVTTIEAVHVAHFDSVDQIADAKAEIFEGLAADGVAVLPRDSRYYDRLARKAGEVRKLSFGTHIQSYARMLDVTLTHSATEVLALIGEIPIAYSVGAIGRPWAVNSLATLAAIDALGGDITAAAATLSGLPAPKGRGARRRITVSGGEALLVDESYNASPASMRAALATLAAQVCAAGGRRIAVMGDMLELGEAGPGLHSGLADAVTEWGIDTVFACGPLMKTMFDRLPPECRGAWAENSADLAPLIKTALRPRDVVMVKGSAGSRMGTIVHTLAGG